MKKLPLFVSAFLILIALAVFFGSKKELTLVNVIFNSLKQSILDSREKLPTPGLIEVAHEKGEISLEQKWLYLVYAFYNYEKLPSKYKSDVGWHGTSVLEDIHDFIERKEVCQFSQETINELESLLKQKIECSGVLRD